jgi:hypothetical protein
MGVSVHDAHGTVAWQGIDCSLRFSFLIAGMNFLIHSVLIF